MYRFVQQVKSSAVSGNMKGGTGSEIQQQKDAKSKKTAEAKASMLFSQLFGGIENKKTMTEAEAAKPKSQEELKAEKKLNWYVDIRDQRNMGLPCSDWSDDQIREYVMNKLANSSTSVICKFYIEAIRGNQIGWFWKCPNGGDECKYLHFLLPGTSINPTRHSDDPEEDDEPIDERLERERAALPPGGTPVSLSSFTAWKKRKEEERINAIKAEMAVAEGKKRGGHGNVQGPVLTGKDLFTFNPDLFIDDDGAAGAEAYEEDKTYWAEVQQENQRALDQANENALNLAVQEIALDENVFAGDDDVDLDELDD